MHSLPYISVPLPHGNFRYVLSILPAGEYIPVVIYFENSAGQSSFDLDTFLSYRQHLGAPNYAGAQVIAIVVTGNARPQ